MSSTPAVGNDVYAEHGRRIIARSLQRRGISSTLPITTIPPVSRRTAPAPKVPTQQEPVGILGAGKLFRRACSTSVAEL